MSVTYRDLRTLEEYAQVVELERVIWGPGYEEVVPVPILAVTVLRGGILVGAFEQRETSNEQRETSNEQRATSNEQRDHMVGFVYSLPGIKHGKPTQWSHMLGVLPEVRNDGVGKQLKLLQRERTLAMGLDLIEWTYDPLQALNAHLNFSKLGVIVEEYEENVYGTSSSPLHAGNPTDRFVAEWWIRRPHVERRIAPIGTIPLVSNEWIEAHPVNRTVDAGKWVESVDVDLSMDARRLLVDIPIGFTEMLSGDAELALAWRICTRAIFTTYFERGYRAVDFRLDRPSRKGTYLLCSKD
jgi:predicted GNAT superfamily acetyltransferase